jgi:hypothetical protein
MDKRKETEILNDKLCLQNVVATGRIAAWIRGTFTREVETSESTSKVGPQNSKTTDKSAKTQSEERRQGECQTTAMKRS